MPLSRKTDRSGRVQGGWSGPNRGGASQNSTSSKKNSNRPESNGVSEERPYDANRSLKITAREWSKIGKSTDVQNELVTQLSQAFPKVPLEVISHCVASTANADDATSKVLALQVADEAGESIDALALEAAVYDENAKDESKDNPCGTEDDAEFAESSPLDSLCAIYPTEPIPFLLSVLHFTAFDVRAAANLLQGNLDKGIMEGLFKNLETQMRPTKAANLTEDLKDLAALFPKIRFISILSSYLNMECNLVETEAVLRAMRTVQKELAVEEPLTDVGTLLAFFPHCNVRYLRWAYEACEGHMETTSQVITDVTDVAEDKAMAKYQDDVQQSVPLGSHRFLRDIIHHLYPGVRPRAIADWLCYFDDSELGIDVSAVRAVLAEGDGNSLLDHDASRASSSAPLLTSDQQKIASKLQRMFQDICSADFVVEICSQERFDFQRSKKKLTELVGDAKDFQSSTRGGAWGAPAPTLAPRIDSALWHMNAEEKADWNRRFKKGSTVFLRGPSFLGSKAANKHQFTIGEAKTRGPIAKGSLVGTRGTSSPRMGTSRQTVETYHYVQLMANGRCEPIPNHAKSDRAIQDLQDNQKALIADENSATARADAVKGPGAGEIRSHYLQQSQKAKRERIGMQQSVNFAAFVDINKGKDLFTEVDLHYLNVEQARTVLKEIIDCHSYKYKAEPDLSRRTTACHIITGRGRGSKKGQARLLPGVVGFLERQGLRIVDVNPGSVSVMLPDPRS
eukprot:Clim_evm41s195 gene=Clim_evmTU41s195